MLFRGSEHIDDMPDLPDSVSTRLEETKVALETIQQDIGRVHVRVTASLATVGAFVTPIDLQTLQELAGWWQRLMLTGIGLLAAAAVFYFQYTQELNKARIRIAAHPTWSSAQVSAAWQPFLEERPIWTIARGPSNWYTAGQLSFGLGGAALLGVVFELLRA